MAVLESPPGYQILDNSAVNEMLATRSICVDLLGGKSSEWQTNEIGDGNLNLVFVVEGPAGSLVVKQALPYMRMMGESWPLPLSRAHFENLALTSQNRLTPGAVPKLIDHDSKLYCTIMEHLTPHIIMRKGMIVGTRYEGFVDVLTTFMAHNLFHTSDLYLSSIDKRKLVGDYSLNNVLFNLTEAIHFSEPFMKHPNNHWTTPQLNGYAERWQQDSELHAVMTKLKFKFLSEEQALLHCDLHTGSVMVTEDDTRVIDPEFACFGPMGFDVGKLFANLFINYYSQTGHEKSLGERDDYRRWILDSSIALWDNFADKFLTLWRAHDAARDDTSPIRLLGDEDAREAQRQAYMAELFTDTLAFCGTCLTRRIMGIAHNIDMLLIEDPVVKGTCEARALDLSRRLLIEQRDFKSIGHVIEVAESLLQTTPELAS